VDLFTSALQMTDCNNDEQELDATKGKSEFNLNESITYTHPFYGPLDFVRD